jgi:hypothetical protein
VTFVALKGAWTIDGATSVDIAAQLPPVQVTVRARGRKLIVSWKDGAAGSVVVAETPNGTLVAQVHAHRATLTDIAPVTRATVTVTPLGGRAVSARLRR